MEMAGAPPPAPTVLVVGGGFAGRKAQRLLQDEGMQTKLMDAKGYFEYTPSALRCMVEPSHAKNCVLPQPAGTITGTLKAVDAKRNEAHTDGGQVVKFDGVILALGSSYAAPIRPEQTWRGTVEARVQEYERAHGTLAAATHIVVVGGGTVGVELAAELAGHWTGRNAKRVTLITASERLLNRMPARAGRLATAWLEHRGVNIITDARVRNATAGSKAIEGGVITLDNGRTVKADLLFPCLGSPPCTQHVAIAGTTIPQGVTIGVTSTGQVLDANRQPLAHVYAAGDACSSSGEKNALNADLNAKLCVRNLCATLRSGKDAPSAPLATWPSDVCFGRRKSPDVVVVSLYKWCAIMQINSIVFSGAFPAFVKWMIEFMQLRTAKGDTVITGLWNMAETLTIFVASFIP